MKTSAYKNISSNHKMRPNDFQPKKLTKQQQQRNKILNQMMEYF